MNENKLLEQLKEAAQDEPFMESLYTSADHTEFAAKLLSKGIELSDDESKQLYEGMKNDPQELSEDSLDTVAGGFVISTSTACWAIAGGCAFLYGCYKSFTKKCK